MSHETTPEITIFLAVLEMEPAERAAYLNESCGQDAQLRARVEALVLAHQKGDRFLDQPPPGLDRTINVDRVVMEAGLSPAFGASDAVVLGNAGHSVLKELGKSIDVPRVVLRDAEEEGATPVERPGSPEIPDRDAESRYRLDGEIARGGMGAILRGRDTDLGRDLAIKVLLKEHQGRPEVIQRFVEEAQIGGQLQHPGIAPVYELGQFSDERPFFSMKLVKGKTLSKLLADREQPAEERGRFIGIFEQVCQTMAYAHSRGVIHRDLKPANVMVGAFGEVQVMDWGLAKVLATGGVADERKSLHAHQDKSIIQTLRSAGSDTPGTFGSVGSHTQMGSVMGTPAYMPPEQALGEIDNMDERADVFGLGAILCEILTGKPPYIGDDSTQVYRLASRGKLDACFQRLGSSGADNDLIGLTKQCLELEPPDRPRDAGVLAERVTGYLESVESRLRKTEIERATESARAVEARKRMRVTLALAASVLLSLFIGGTAWRQMELKELERRKVATRNIESAMNDALLHQSLADSAGTDARVVELETAVSSAEEAVTLAHQENIEPELSSRAIQLLAKLRTKYENVKRVAELVRKDREFQEELELIRLSQSDGVMARVQVKSQEGPDDSSAADVSQQEERYAEGGLSEEEFEVVEFFDFSSAVERYNNAFSNAGFDLKAMSPTEAAQKIRASAIRETLIAALDNWARAIDDPKASASSEMGELDSGDLSAPETIELSRPNLMAIANDADNSEWRKTLRAALLADDTSKLRQMATTEEARAQSPELIAWMGAALREAQEVDESVAVLLEAQRRHPEDFWMNYELGKSYVLKGDHLEGLGYSRTAFGMRPGSVGAMMALAVASAEAGQHEDAKILYRKVIAKNPRLIEAHTGLALAAMSRYQRDEAIDAYRAAVQLKPNSAKLRRALAVALKSDRRTDEAVVEATKAVELEPNRAEAYVILAALLGDKSAKEETLRTAIKLDAQNAEAHYELARLLKFERGSDEALSFMLKAIELGYQDGGVRTGRIVLPLLDTGRQDEAVSAGRLVVRNNPDGARAHCWLAHALEQSGDLDEAVREHRKAVELAPTDNWNIQYLGQALLKQGLVSEGISLLLGVYRPGVDYSWYGSDIEFSVKKTIADLVEQGRAARATAILKDALNEGHDFDLVIDQLAFVFQQQNQTDDVATYRKVVESVPHCAAAHTRLLDVLQRHGQSIDVASFCKSAVQLNNDNPGFLNRMARYLVTTPSADGRYLLGEEALRWAKAASESSPDNPDYRLTLGIAQYRQGQWEGARRSHLRSYFQGSFDGQRNWLFLAMTYSRLGKTESAVDAFKRALAKLRRPDAELKNLYAEAHDSLGSEAMELLLESASDNADVAAYLANRILAEKENANDWTILEPVEMKSDGGAEFELLDDSSVLVSGPNRTGDRYSIAIDLKDSTELSALRLEALTHDSLPYNGPGRSEQGPCGIFTISYPEVVLRSPTSAESRIVLDKAASDYVYNKRPMTVRRWNIAEGAGKPRTAVYSLQEPIKLPSGSQLLINIQFWDEPNYPQRNLGRFRLSLCGDSEVFEYEARRLTALSLTDTARLAAAYLVCEEESKLASLLEKHPELVEQLSSKFTIPQWAQTAVLNAYDQLFANDRPDVETLRKRAALSVSFGRWAQAATDWTQVVEQHPEDLQVAFDTFRNARQWKFAAEFGLRLHQKVPEPKSWKWIRAATVMVKAGDQQRYIDVCEMMRQAFADSEDPADSERIVKASLLWPNLIDIDTLPTERFARALDAGTTVARQRGWHWGTRALLAYRRVEPELAINYVTSSEKNETPEVGRALILSVLAMVHHDLGQSDEALTALAEASETIAIVAAATPDKGDHDLLAAEILYREANEKINGEQKSVVQSEASKEISSGFSSE